MSGYPIRRDIVLRGDSACLVHQKEFHRRLELLFNVHVNVSTQGRQYKDRSVGSELVVDSGASRWVTVRGKSEEDCLKTQRYVLASSKPEVKVLVPCGPQLLKVLFEDNPTIRDKIERDIEVLIIAAPKDGGLYIQGAQYQVQAAVDRVYGLADTIPTPACISKTTDTTSSKYTTTTNTQSNIKTAPPPPSITTNTTNFIMDRDPTCIPRTAPQTTGTLDTRRINKYVMLGFPVEQVQSVIESLGPHASENDVMSRLISVNPSNKSTLPPTVVENLSKEGLRPIVIDGSNVAMKHANGKYFSCKGIEIALKYFLSRGHSEITIFVPQWRKEPSRPETPIKDQEILFQMESAGYIKYTPSRRFGSRKIVCYDDRFIIQLAYERGGIIVSDDNFRDLFEENKSWQETIEKRVLQFVFVEDRFMVPQDPLGKHGPHLDVFLRFESGISPNRNGGGSDQHPIPKDKTPCPYKEKCSFGPRCRYYHPERETKQREKEAQEETTSGGGGMISPASVDWYRTNKEQQKEDNISMGMNNLSIKTNNSSFSPRKVVNATHPYIEISPDTPPGGLRRTHPIIGHHPISHSGPPMDREMSYSHIPHDQWGNAGRQLPQPREEHSNVMSATMARGGSDRHTPTSLTMSPTLYNHSIRPHPHMQSRPPHIQPHVHLDYHQSHYHPPLHGNEHPAGYPANIPTSSRPHSSNLIGYNTGYAHYKDPRELDQIQSLDHNQKMIYEKAVENFPQHRDRILALIIQFCISDFNTLTKALGK